MAETDPVQSDIPEFQIGLAMAGAISAGAYTAGVADFLFQALTAWETGGVKGLAEAVDDEDVAAERSGYSNDPAHRVMLASMAGASAGGITSAIVAAVTGGPVEPVTQVPPPGGTENPFYLSWVERIDMTYFLELKDIERTGGRLPSLLDSTQLDAITEQALRIKGPHPRRAFIADPLRVFLTVSNLRGVPYQIGQQGGMHHMMSHADYMEFAVTENASLCPPSAIRLDPTNYDHPDWQVLGQSALASGAFPVGLAPRKLRRRAGEYAARDWAVPGETGTEYQKIKPAWNFSDTDDYDFVTVDGGLMNNEPLELARRALRREGQSRNSRKPKLADRAVLMIDPFPGSPFDPDAQPDDALATVVKSMFGALKSEARFKLDELVLAQNADVYSRFMIAPSRQDPETGKPARFAMSSAALGGFGGFLSQRFREHDFNLGRRNCQRFLMRHFLLHQDNPLFARWPEALKKSLARPHPSAGTDVADHLPIVPLVGAALDETPALPWPQMSQAEMDALKAQMKTRAGGVLKAILRPRLIKPLEALATMALKGYVASEATKAISADLLKRGQLPPAMAADPEEEYNTGD